MHGRVQETESCAIYIHCRAHRLNLAFQNTCTARDIRKVLGVYRHYTIFWKVVVNDIKLAEAQQSAAASSSNHPTVTLKQLCEMRWSSRCCSVHAVFSNYSAFLETLTFIPGKDSGADANSLLLT